MEPIDKLRTLHAELVARRPRIDHLARYYDGLHNLAFAGPEFLEAFGGLFRSFADNWCGVVVDAVDERMRVEGFRVNNDPKGDEDAKRIWEANELDAQSQMGHTDGLIAGAFFVTVWPSDDDPATPEITVESATQTVVECHPKIRRRRTAALRTWLDDDGYEHAELFLPDDVYCYRSKSKRTAGIIDARRAHWVVDDHPDVADKLDASGRMPNPYGTIPVVEFLNRPRLHLPSRIGWGAHSEISKIVPLQDAVNKLLADLLVASEFAAYPQRHLTGYEADTDDTTGQIITPKFESGPGKVWWLEDTDARFGQFDNADLTGYVGAVDLIVKHIAAISATPPHYLNPGADRLSGESIKSAETGLVAKARRKMRHAGASWEEVMRLAGLVAGISDLANAQQMETIWSDPETRTESEHVDAVLKKKAANVPDPQIWEELGYSQEQVARFPAMAAQAQLEGMASAAARRAELAIAPPPANPAEV